MASRRHLYVGGLSREIEDESVVRAVFVPFGEVLSLSMPVDAMTQKHRGFAFVEFEDPSDAAEALDNLHKAELYGSVLKVTFSKPPKQGAAGKAVWADDEYIKEHIATSEGLPDTMDPSAAPVPPAKRARHE